MSLTLLALYSHQKTKESSNLFWIISRELGGFLQDQICKNNFTIQRKVPGCVLSVMMVSMVSSSLYLKEYD